MSRRSGDTKGVLAVIGLGAAMVVCCAGPVLIGAGAAGVIGGALRSPWLIGAAVVLAVAAIVYTTMRQLARRHRVRDGVSTGGDCCPPFPPPPTPSRDRAPGSQNSQGSR